KATPRVCGPPPLTFRQMGSLPTLGDLRWSRFPMCLPLPGETACSCLGNEGQRSFAVEKSEPSTIEGWIAFPTAIADGTATGTVFLETTPQAGVRSRVIANLSVNRGGVQ